MYSTKGARVRIQFFQLNDPPSCLAGAQLKFGAKEFSIEGTVRHVRGEAPTEAESKDIRLWVQPDEPVPEGLRLTKCEKCGCGEIPMLSPSVVKVIL